MIKKMVIDVTVRVNLEIDTDLIGYGIHGGEETPERIAEKAVDYFAQEVDYGFPFDGTPGIKVLTSEMTHHVTI